VDVLGVAVAAAQTSIGPWFSRRAIAAAALCIAFVVGGAFLYNAGTGRLGSVGNGSGALHAIGAKIGQAVSGVDTVAALLAGRSPGERAGGALASLKHKRGIALHERALPKIRSAPPVRPLASIVGAPAVPPAIVPPSTGPLYNTIAAAPPAVILPGASQSPIVFPALSPPPGGGLIVPPIVTQVTPPVPPEITPPQAVPEAPSWAMMLIGFGLIGWVVRRRGTGVLVS
jgi:hypothetical protein